MTPGHRGKGPPAHGDALPLIVKENLTMPLIRP